MNQNKTSVLPQILFRPAAILWLSLAIGLGLTAAALFSHDLYRDCAAVYAPMVRSFVNGDTAGAFHPNLPCLNVLLAIPLAELGLSPERALTVVSGLFFIGAIPFLYGFLKHFLPELQAAYGALLYITTPKLIRYSCTGLIDSGKIFFVIMGFYFAARLYEKRFGSFRDALGFGAALGGILWARSEGIGNSLVFWGGMVLLYVCTSIREKRKYPIGPLLAALIVLIAGIGVRIAFNKLVCHEWVLDQRVQGGICGLWNRLFHPAVPAVSKAKGALIVSTVPRPNATWGDVFKHVWRGGYEVYFILAALSFALQWLSRKPEICKKMRFRAGFFAFPAAVRWTPFLWLVPLMMAGNVFIFKAAGIAEYRYFLFFAPLLLIFALPAADWLISLLQRFVPAVIMISAAVVILGYEIDNGMRPKFTAEPAQIYRTGLTVGKIIREENPQAKVWFHSASVEWYYTNLERARGIETPRVDDRYFADFDYVLSSVPKKGKKSAFTEILKGRQDLQEIPLGKESTVTLFRKIQK